jgi:uncharacterized protein (TIGR02117 family)
MLLAALIGSLWPVNRGWVEPVAGTTVWITASPIHTAIIVPVSAEGIDLSLTFRPTDLPDPADMGQYLAIGWGDRDFYVNTPTWSDLTLSTLTSAVIGSGQSVLHVDHIARPEDAAKLRPVRLTRAQYQRLIAAITATLTRGRDGLPHAEPGYGSRDLFYASTRAYHGGNTCNVWTGDMLAAAGVRTGLWSPMPQGIIWWFDEAAFPH